MCPSIPGSGLKPSCCVLDKLEMGDSMFAKAD